MLQAVHNNSTFGEQMKIFLIAMSLFFGLNSSFACSNPEAQFIGNVTKYSLSECTFKIEFTRYNESIVCPLNFSEASSTVFVDKSCSLTDGDIVSGILVMDKDKDKVVIE